MGEKPIFPFLETLIANSFLVGAEILCLHPLLRIRILKLHIFNMGKLKHSNWVRETKEGECQPVFLVNKLIWANEGNWDQ